MTNLNIRLLSSHARSKGDIASAISVSVFRSFVFQKAYNLDNSFTIIVNENENEII